MRDCAIIVAGGEGIRMGSPIPKQFLNLLGKPLLFYTLEAFINSLTKPELILVMHEDHLERWKTICKEYDFRHPHYIIPGGRNRTESVFKGLQVLEPLLYSPHFPEWIAVHDAVRPLATKNFIDKSYAFARENGNSIPNLPLRESIRLIRGKESKSVGRENFRLIQTPQIFPGTLLYEAYKTLSVGEYTDDASLFENMGHTIHLMEGDPQNIKITYPLDLILSEHILKNKNEMGNILEGF